MKTAMILLNFAILLSFVIMLGHLMFWIEELIKQYSYKTISHHRMYTIIFFFIAGFIIFMRGFL